MWKTSGDHSLMEFSFIFTKSPGYTSYIKHSITLTEVKPCQACPYTASPVKKELISRHIQQILKDSIVNCQLPSLQAWTSPVVLVPKLDAPTCFCVDFGQLNKKMVYKAYQMSFIQETLE